MTTIGFIGLGIMGRPMARQLLLKGTPLLIYDIDQEAVKDLTASGAVSATLAEIGRSCPIIFLILPSGNIVRQVLFDQDGLCTAIQSGTVIVDMSSVTPQDSQICAQRLQPMGVRFLDAPVSGGEPKAIDGTLSFMVGGDQADFDQVLPYFKKMGSNATLVGQTGSGSVTKLANQIIVNLTIAAISEAMVLACKAGVDPDKVYQAIRGGLAGSTVLDAKVPKMIHRDFKAGGKLSINHKDIRNVMLTAKELGVPLPFSSQLLDVMQNLMDRQLQDDDHAGIVKYFEKLADVTVQSQPD